jgi:hypothetical protein
VTGAKTDNWLVQTVGVLVTVIGATLCLAAIRGAMPLEVIVLGAGSGAALGMVDHY